MKTDKFNEIIRQKLLGAEPPPYHETDWERMSAFMKSKNPPTFWQQYSQAIWYGSGMVAIVGLLIINLTQLNENKRLLQEIKTISEKSQTEAVASANQVGIQDSEAGHIATRNPNIQEVTGVSQNAEVATGVVQNSQLLIVNHQSSIKNIEANIAVVQNAIASVSRVNHTSKLSQNLTQNRSHRRTESSVGNQNTEVATGSIQNSQLSISNIEANAFAAQNSRPTTYDPEQLQITELADLQTDLADGVKNKKLRVRTPDEMTWPTEPKKIKPVRLTALPLRVQIGVSGLVESRLFGSGLSAEVLIGKRWSVNVGLDVVRVGGEQFLSDEQFNQKRKKDFRDLYAPSQRVPATADILNINSSLQLVQLPVFVSYRYPLQKNYTLLFSTGSTFDLSVKEKISFNYRPTRQDFGTETRNESRDFSVFNNLWAGVGIEKRWSRFVVQAQPQIGYKIVQMQLPNNEDRDDHPQAGIRLRALYRFGK